MLFFFLSSGLFLGWSLGANDAANIFGSAVGSRMLKFRTAAIIAAIFVVIGAMVQGAGASNTLGKLGSVNALAGSFTVALSAAISVFWMTKLKFPVSTTQAIVGAIIGWNFYTGNPTDYNSLGEIASTWIFSPILGAVFSILLFLVVKKLIVKSRIHLFDLDHLIRISLILVTAFGAYSLGANNIANVVGVFLPLAPKTDIDFILFSINGTQQIYLIGAMAIAAGILTYSKKVIETVGNDIIPLSFETALVVILAQSLVLFIFSSQSLSNILIYIGLPPIPLVPVSSSQVIVGSIVGIGLLKEIRNIRLNVLGGIALGWIITPLLAGLTSFILLFFVNNVFKLEVEKTETVAKEIPIEAPQHNPDTMIMKNESPKTIFKNDSLKKKQN
jgi:PiT family inorganic phosphate transporter